MEGAINSDPSSLFYEKNAKLYFEKTYFLDSFNILSKLTEFLRPGSKILDLGCGSGRDILWLSKEGYFAEGVEKSRNLCKLAEEQTDCRIYNTDFHTFDFRPDSYDAITSIGGFVHLSPQELDEIVSKSIISLRNDGIYFISLKKGEGFYTGSDGRIFYLWQKEKFLEIAKKYKLHLINYEEQETLLKSKDVWMSFIFRKNK